jgi:predicted RNA-binding Zn-ribbon protein involved in translation (DUF1610 family)
MSTAIAPDDVADAPAKRKFPCDQCGARLDFDPTVTSLKCPYCGGTKTIYTDYTPVQERDYDHYVETGVADHRTIAGRSQQTKCGGCGAVVLLEDNVATDRCPFCATHLEAPEPAEAMIHPESILPFAVDYRKAKEAFENWISARWFAPSGLKQLANLGRLNGIYVPFWTYDAMTYTRYHGRRGEEKTAGVDPMTDDLSVVAFMGMRNNSRRQFVWRDVSGEVHHFFDDTLICASTSIPIEQVMQLQPWDLENLVGFKADYLSGFKTQRYAVDLQQGFSLSKIMMEPTIKGLCLNDIGGDVQILDSYHIKHERVTFKHVLLPVWLASYRYYDKVYQIMVNARTGEVVGDRPWSVFKIGFLSVILLALAALILWFTQ